MIEVSRERLLSSPGVRFSKLWSWSTYRRPSNPLAVCCLYKSDSESRLSMSGFTMPVRKGLVHKCPPHKLLLLRVQMLDRSGKIVEKPLRCVAQKATKVSAASACQVQLSVILRTRVVIVRGQYMGSWERNTGADQNEKLYKSSETAVAVSKRVYPL